MQGFGKRSGAIGMPRPKKAKVLPKEVSRMESLPAASAEITSSEGDSVSPSLMAEAPSATSFEVVDKAMLKDAATVTKMARASVKEAAVEVRVAEAKLRHERRLDKEREQRWWAAERRSEQPPAYLQLERAYKSQVKDLKARLELSEARRREAEARVELQGCLLMQEQLAHARLRDRLCGEVM